MQIGANYRSSRLHTDPVQYQLRFWGVVQLVGRCTVNAPWVISAASRRQAQERENGSVYAACRLYAKGQHHAEKRTKQQNQLTPELTPASTKAKAHPCSARAFFALRASCCAGEAFPRAWPASQDVAYHRITGQDSNL